MAQLVVRNLDEEVKAKLRRRATAHGRSMEEEVRTILQNAVLRDDGEGIGLGSQIAALFSGIEGNDEPLEEFSRKLQQLSKEWEASGLREQRR